MHLLLIGLPIHRQTVAAVRAARKAGRALDVVRVSGEGASNGKEAPQNGGLRDLIGDPQLVVVMMIGTGTLTIQVFAGVPECHQKW